MRDIKCIGIGILFGVAAFIVLPIFNTPEKHVWYWAGVLQTLALCMAYNYLPQKKKKSPIEETPTHYLNKQK